MAKKYVFKITPQSWVRVTVNDKWFFRIPRDQLKPEGLKRLKRLEKYNNYKITLLSMAKQQKFVLPEQGADITFFLPVSKTWKKHKKASMHMKLHQYKPDLSNMLKAWEDSLLIEDKHIANYSGLTKLWVNEEQGRIEVIVRTPTISSSDTLS